jgi:protein gp37
VGETTGIAWTDHTFNPWIGCAKVCPECVNCYAEGYGQRFGVAWGERGDRRRTSPSNWRQPLRWHRAAVRDGVRRRVFCASLADVFEDRADLEPWRRDLFDLIEECYGLDWLLLTKRPEDVREMAHRWRGDWPVHVWLGTSAGTQETADRAIPHLLRVNGPQVRFLSAEPLLGPIDFREVPGFNRVGLDLGGWWVIVGGESGPRARPCSVSWVRSIVRQCRVASVPVFVKQLGANYCDTANGIGGRSTKDPELMTLTGRLRDSAGRDMAEWPEDLRVREYPR